VVGTQCCELFGGFKKLEQLLTSSPGACILDLIAYRGDCDIMCVLQVHIV
jgi:hypothetical protein